MWRILFLFFTFRPQENAALLLPCTQTGAQTIRISTGFVHPLDLGGLFAPVAQIFLN
jgi:hypothetical protein